MQLSIQHVYQKPLEGLYLISTPIGNSYDISLRALATLQGVDQLFAEDTRVTQKLLSLYGIEREVLSYHEHNAAQQEKRIQSFLQQGYSVGYVSDAGTPLIRDPGYGLVQLCVQHQIPFTAVPGPSAVINGLVLSGLSADIFQFGGFIPSKTSARKAFLTQFANYTHTLVFFETGPRLKESLKDILEVLGDRQMTVAREMTKIFESVSRGSVMQLRDTLQEERGEFVLILQGCSKTIVSHAEIQMHLERLLETKPLKMAAAIVAEAFDKPRQEIYTLGLKLKEQVREP